MDDCVIHFRVFRSAALAKVQVLCISIMREEGRGGFELALKTLEGGRGAVGIPFYRPS